tara:strand:- start:8273 stop:8584 length:312 start_codon:yes stop_codon:yes gene_type:complete
MKINVIKKGSALTLQVTSEPYHHARKRVIFTIEDAVIYLKKNNIRGYTPDPQTRWFDNKHYGPVGEIKFVKILVDKRATTVIKSTRNKKTSTKKISKDVETSE